MLIAKFAKAVDSARRAAVIAKPMFQSRVMSQRERDILMKKTFAELNG